MKFLLHRNVVELNHLRLLWCPLIFISLTLHYGIVNNTILRRWVNRGTEESSKNTTLTFPIPSYSMQTNPNPASYNPKIPRILILTRCKQTSLQQPTQTPLPTKPIPTPSEAADNFFPY